MQSVAFDLALKSRWKYCVVYPDGALRHRSSRRFATGCSKKWRNRPAPSAARVVHSPANVSCVVSRFAGVGKLIHSLSLLKKCHEVQMRMAGVNVGLLVALCAAGCGGSAESMNVQDAGGSAANGGDDAAGAKSPAAGGGGVGGTGAAGRTAANGGAGAAAQAPEEPFSFFVTSLEAMRELSGSENGFGGDLRYGESTGLAGADKICTEIAESSMPGAGQKGWRAFLSAKAGGPSGGAVNARDRIGAGPWYDRSGRLVSKDLASLLATRPAADAAIANDLPNERGEPNHGSPDIDNHDTVTGSDAQGNYSGGVTCEDWTSTQTTSSSGGRGGKGPMCGHSWPRQQSGQSWIAAHAAPGCGPSVGITESGAGSGTGIGNGGGYGGIYCFALKP
jgi:hypothetical protein